MVTAATKRSLPPSVRTSIRQQTKKSVELSRAGIRRGTFRPETITAEQALAELSKTQLPEDVRAELAEFKAKSERSLAERLAAIPGAKKAETRVLDKVQRQPTKFEQLAERPFGAFQRVPISELKKPTPRLTPEDIRRIRASQLDTPLQETSPVLTTPDLPEPIFVPERSVIESAKPEGDFVKVPIIRDGELRFITDKPFKEKQVTKASQLVTKEISDVITLLPRGFGEIAKDSFDIGGELRFITEEPTEKGREKIRERIKTKFLGTIVKPEVQAATAAVLFPLLPTQVGIGLGTFFFGERASKLIDEPSVTTATQTALIGAGLFGPRIVKGISDKVKVTKVGKGMVIEVDVKKDFALGLKTKEGGGFIIKSKDLTPTRRLTFDTNLPVKTTIITPPPPVVRQPPPVRFAKGFFGLVPIKDVEINPSIGQVLDIAGRASKIDPEFITKITKEQIQLLTKKKGKIDIKSGGFFGLSQPPSPLEGTTIIDLSGEPPAQISRGVGTLVAESFLGEFPIFGAPRTFGGQPLRKGAGRKFKKSKLKRLSKGEIRKRQQGRAFDPRFFGDKGQVGARIGKGLTVKAEPGKIILERKPPRGQVAVREEPFVKSFKKGTPLEERIGTRETLVGRPKARETFRIDEGKIIGSTKEIIFPGKQISKGRPQSQARRLVERRRASKELEKFLGGETSKLTGVLLVEKKMPPFREIEKRVPVPKRMFEILPESKRLILEKPLTEKRIKKEQRLVKKQIQQEKTTGGFRKGIRESLFGKLQQRQRAFVLVEQPTSPPRVDLPALIGKRGLVSPRVVDTSATIKSSFEGQLGGLRSGGRVGLGSKGKLGVGRIAGAIPRVDQPSLSGTRSALGIIQLTGIASRSRTDQFSGVDILPALDTATAQRLEQATVQETILDIGLPNDIPPQDFPPDRIPPRPTQPRPSQKPRPKPPKPKLPKPPRPKPPRPKPPTEIIETINLKGEGKSILGLGVSRNKVQAYNTQIKKPLGKNFVKANRKPLTRAEAINLGARLTDKFVNRSFTIRKTKEKVRQSNVKINQNLLGRFRSSKKNPNIFVEKSQFAISSREERQGIPYKAARLRRAGLIPTKGRRTRFL